MCSTQVNGKLTGELPLFCPLESCSHYQKPDNTIKKDGIYRTQSDPVPRQMYYCHGGGHRFSETHYSELKHKQGSMKEYEQTAKLFFSSRRRHTRLQGDWSSDVCSSD